MSLQELSLVHVSKISNQNLIEFFQGLADQSSLSKFTFNNTEILYRNNEAFSHLITFLKLSKRQISSHVVLTHLDLSNNHLTTKQLSRIIRALQNAPNLQFLNLSGNKLVHIKSPEEIHDENPDNLKYLMAGDVRKEHINYVDRFNKGLLELIKNNQQNLTHLDLSGMVDFFYQKDVLNKGNIQKVL